MISYQGQVAICNSVRETIRQELAESDDMGIRAKVNSIPTTESVLRAVSLFPTLNTEGKLKDFMVEHILEDLRLTESQKEHFKLTGQEPLEQI